jgi:hypothetical protein
VHDVFHASLLRIHQPNDDRLFPGRLDNQIGGEVDPEGEWAVDKILSHSGSKEDSIFEIKWKAGDVTWLPYAEISHLQALPDYLEVLGIDKVSDLPPGRGKPPVDDPQVHLGTISFREPLSTRKTYKIVIRTRQIFSSLVNRLSDLPRRILPCVDNTNFDSESEISSIHSIPTSMSNPTVHPYPAVNNNSVTQTGKYTFTLHHPDDTSGFTIPLTITAGAIFEIFNHHDAILKLEKKTEELKPEPLAWDRFTRFWNAHAGDGPRFVTWNSGDGFYSYPTTKLVTLADLNLTRRIPKIVLDVTKVPKDDTTTSAPSRNVSTTSKVVHPHKVATPSSTTTTTSSTATASGPASLADLLPAELTGGLVTTGLARYIRQETQKLEYFKQRDQERKAKAAATRNERKKKKKLVWKGKAAVRGSTSGTHPSNEDVTMADAVDDNQPSSSKNPGA